MNQTPMDSDVLFLPHEIIRNFLKRLPVKSLIRFQCVCKDWKNLMQNPSFLADHLQQSTHQNPSLLLECKGMNILLRFRRLILLDCGLRVRGDQNSPWNNPLRNARIVGSCNGLLCLEIHQFNQPPHSLSLWNPKTRAVRHVPRTRTDISYFNYCVTGFGPSIMNQTPMDSDVLFLPHDIIRNFLKRLPVKSLIRFQCVCKDWKNLMQNPSFIADHLQQSTHQNPSLLLECMGMNILLGFRHLVLLDCGLRVRGDQNSPWNNPSRNARIVGSCNGLLCLEIHRFNRSAYSLSLWNPATTAIRHVPRTRTDSSNFDECVTGFGFSLNVNDYKIVRICYDFYNAVTVVEVFSLNRGTWKAIDIGNLKGVRLKSKTVTANGAIFWSGVKLVGEKKEGEDNIDFQEAEDKVDVIVSFDIAKEVFTVIPRPELDYDANVKLTVYENKLAILCDTRVLQSHVIELWVLYEGTCASGQTWSWTKRYTSSSLSCTLDPMIIWRNEIVYKPIFEGHDDGGRRNVLYMTNLTTNEVKRSVIPYHESIVRIYNYVESLVSVGNDCIEES